MAEQTTRNIKWILRDSLPDETESEQKQRDGIIAAWSLNNDLIRENSTRIEELRAEVRELSDRFSDVVELKDMSVIVMGKPQLGIPSVNDRLTRIENRLSVLLAVLSTAIILGAAVWFATL